MSSLYELYAYPSSFYFRILIILSLVTIGHLVVIGLKKSFQVAMQPRQGSRTDWQRKFPKAVTLITLITSSLTFLIYFGAGGLLLSEFGISVTAYLASASVIGLAVAFGSQGFVQDIVVGLTLIFTDVIDVGDMVDLAGQTGKVHQVGLRFTVLKNGRGQQVFVNNRNIGQINRYKDNELTLQIDLVVPEGVSFDDLKQRLDDVAKGTRQEFSSIVLSEPKWSNQREATPGDWSYVCLQLSVWPGQEDPVKETLKKRFLDVIQREDPDYPDWKITITTKRR
jgi:small conductance mechanosensitive channel